MKLTSADREAWSIVADVLPKIAAEEVEILPALAVSVHENPTLIGSQPGAFNAIDVASIAISSYGLIIEVFKQYAPKLFDAGIDITKEVLKERLSKKKTLTEPSEKPQQIVYSVDLASLRKFVLKTGATHNLDASASEAIANAIVTHIAIKQQRNPPP